MRLPRLSLRWKTILGVAVIEAALLLLLVTLAVNQMTSASNEGLIKRATTAATLFATTSKDATLSLDLASLESFVREVMKTPDLRYARVVAGDGQVLAQSGDSGHFVNGFVPDSSLDSVTDGVFDAASQIAEGGVIYGYAQLGISTARIEDGLAAVQQWSISIALLELILVATFSWMLGTYLMLQLVELRKAARAVSEDALDVKVPIKNRDEIGDVARAFNRMIENLQASRKLRDEYENRLRSANETLELRVKERTAQLNGSLENLNQAKTRLEHEIVERERVESQMRQAQKLEAVGQLAAGVAHEINTPIQYIGDSMGFLNDAYEDIQEYIAELRKLTLTHLEPNVANQFQKELSQLDDELDITYLNESAPAAINRAREGIQRVTEIVSAMKSFGSGNASKKAPTDVNHAIKQTLLVSRHEYRYLATASTDLAEDLPKLTCHVTDLTQALLLMIVNAAEAIEARFGNGDKGKIHVTSRLQDDQILITVSDNGAGMMPEIVDRIFDPFFTTKEVGNGTGQGLTTVYDIIVNAHDGQVFADSTPNEGTTFYILLPLTREKFRNFLQENMKSSSIPSNA